MAHRRTMGRRTITGMGPIIIRGGRIRMGSAAVAAAAAVRRRKRRRMRDLLIAVQSREDSVCSE
jgi:carbonic anhydrase/acetyltransferase-like protein (isoleucine patch superfamily)